LFDIGSFQAGPTFDPVKYLVFPIPDVREIVLGEAGVFLVKLGADDGPLVFEELGVHGGEFLA
jgi:hypothetical protein